MIKNMRVSEIVSTVKDIISMRPYSRNYIRDLNYIFRRFMSYCDNKSFEYYSAEIGEQFLSELYGIRLGEKSNKCTQVQRVINMLTEYQRLGVVVPHKTKGREYPSRFVATINTYIDKLKREFKREQTLLRAKTILLKFTEYLDQNRLYDLSSLTADDVNLYYSRCLNNYSKKYVHDNVNLVKRFLHYLYETNVIADDISVKLLEIHCKKAPKHIPDVFTDEEIERILAVVDTANPVGKRDYAILLIAIRLGLRQSDIKNLKPSNIDWYNKKINIVQVKTNQPLTLPLPNDVGWAIIDYLKNGRPKCDTLEIFVRSIAPYTRLEYFDSMLSKYMRLAGISLMNKYHHGFHTFRHSLATKMLKNDIPLSVIQETLGQRSINTTKVYTGINHSQLSECSLEVPPYEKN